MSYVLGAAASQVDFSDAEGSTITASPVPLTFAVGDEGTTGTRVPPPPGSKLPGAKLLVPALVALLTWAVLS